MTLINGWGVPGMDTAVLSTENAFLWGADTWYLTKPIQIASACVDSGSSTTTDLRPGLVMGKLSASNQWTAYVATNSDGSQYAEGVLFTPVRMLDPLSGLARISLGIMVVAGPVKGANLYGLDNVARSQMEGRFIFDDNLYGTRMPWKQEVAKTANYSVVAGDANTLFTNTGATGAVTFTLPTRAAGLSFDFLVTANQNVTISSAAGTDIVTANNAAASNLAFSSASDKIGARVRITCNAAGTLWYVDKLCSNAMTIT